MPVDQPTTNHVLSASRGRLESVHVSEGGVPKGLVEGRVEITASGVAGDRQRHLKIHGGPDRAVCLFAREVIDDLRRNGHPIAPGTTGENLTISGLDWNEIAIARRLRVGEVILEITKPAHPCRNIAGSFSDGDFSRMSAKIHPGRGRMYARVLSPGFVGAGDEVVLEPEAKPLSLDS